jgi:hypothetical protein
VTETVGFAESPHGKFGHELRSADLKKWKKTLEEYEERWSCHEYW